VKFPVSQSARNFFTGREVLNTLRRNCIMTNVMHKFLICLSIYFCLTCFGLSISPSVEAGVYCVGHYTISFQSARPLQHKILIIYEEFLLFVWLWAALHLQAVY
jgi:hypothetical protein